jgi:gluconate 5-dehydrogenase
MMLFALGGRGIASGAHLRRFDSVDFTLWPEGQWPDKIIKELRTLYPVAEDRRRVSKRKFPGPAQDWAKDQLKGFAPTVPPVGVDLETNGRFDVSRGYDSSVSRLWRLLISDCLEDQERRLWVAPNLSAVRFYKRGSKCSELEVVDNRKQTTRVRSCVYILAASPVESARLVLHSGLGFRAAGHYLAEHIERRAKVVLSKSAAQLGGEGISLVITPPPSERNDPQARFQVHLRGEKRGDDIVVDIGGFAAMDPDFKNHVELMSDSDSFGLPKVRTFLNMSANDEARADRLCDRICEIAELLGAKEFITNQFPLEAFKPQYTKQDRVQLMPPGRSYHEAGTLRAGEDEETSATDPDGKLRGIDNLYIADGALFPNVGIANPMLTVTALAYHVANSAAKYAMEKARP